MLDFRLIVVCALVFSETKQSSNDFMTTPEEAPCAAPSGDEFVVAFIDDLSGDQGDLQLRITNPGEKNATVQVLTPYLSDKTPAYVNIKDTIEPLETSVFYLPNTLRVLATGYEKNVVKLLSDKNVHVLAVQNGTSRTSSFIVYPSKTFNVHTTIVTGDVDSGGLDASVVIIIPQSSSKRKIQVELSDRSVIEWRGKVYKGSNANYTGDLPYGGPTITLRPSGGKFAVLSSKTDLSGSWVHSKFRFITFAGNTGSGSNSDLYRHQVQQMLPDVTSGTYFTTLSFPNPSTESVFKAIATEPNTSITVTTASGTKVHYVANMQPAFITIANPAGSILRVNATRRIKLFQTQMDVDGKGNTRALRTVPALEHLTTSFTFAVPFEGETDVTVHAIKDNSDTVMLDDVEIYGDEWTVIGGKKMMYAERRVTKGVHGLRSDTGNALLSVQGIYRGNGIDTSFEAGHITCGLMYSFRSSKNNHCNFIEVTSRGLQLPELSPLDTINGPVMLCMQRCLSSLYCGAVIDLGVDSNGTMSCETHKSNLVYYGTNHPMYVRYREKL